MPMRGRHAVVPCVVAVVVLAVAVLAVGCSSEGANDADVDDGVGTSTESTAGAEETGT
jgi:hypothetical protein